MKLLIVIHSLHSGGAERVTTNLVNHWAEKGWQVTVVTMESRKDDFYTLHASVRRVALELASPSFKPVAAIRNNLRRVTALHSVLREVRPDAAVGMMSSAGILLVLAAIFVPKISVVVSEHNYPPAQPLGQLWSRLRRFIYPKATIITMLTSEGLNWLNAVIPDARGVVMPNPISYPLPVTEPRLAPDTVIKPERRLLLAVGRFVHLKGFDYLLTAFEKLAPANPDWDLVILGEGPLRQALELQAQALELRERVFLPGIAGNVSDWYRRADLFAMSSRTEGFPNTLGEAMAHGCPVVSFDCDTGPRDIIRHQVDGLLVANGDVVAFEDALGRLMADSAFRQRLADRVIEVRERFSIEKVAGMWEDLFLKCAKKNDISI